MSDTNGSVLSMFKGERLLGVVTIPGEEYKYMPELLGCDKVVVLTSKLPFSKAVYAYINKLGDGITISYTIGVSCDVE